MLTTTTERAPKAGQSLFFLYHELRPSHTDYSYVLACGRFAQQVDLFARLRTSPAPSLRPEITFDDGHLSDFEYAMPILNARGLGAHFFITAGWTGHKPGYMGWNELRSLHKAGHGIGGHGWTHTLLTHCSDDELQLELVRTRSVLEDKLGASVTTMSLPGGRFNRRVLAACRAAGYSRIFTSMPKAESMLKAEAPSFGALVGRLNIRPEMTIDWLERLLQPGSHMLSSLERRHRMKSAAKMLIGDRLYSKLWAIANRQESPSPRGSGETDS